MKNGIGVGSVVYNPEIWVVVVNAEMDHDHAKVIYSNKSYRKARDKYKELDKSGKYHDLSLWFADDWETYEPDYED